MSEITAGFGYSGGLTSSPFEAGGVTPQKLKVVIGAVGAGEDVKYDIHEIYDNPQGVIRTANAEWTLPDSTSVFNNTLSHPTHLAIRGPCRNDRKIGDGRNSANIKGDDIL